MLINNNGFWWNFQLPNIYIVLFTALKALFWKATSRIWVWTLYSNLPPWTRTLNPKKPGPWNTDTKIAGCRKTIGKPYNMIINTGNLLRRDLQNLRKSNYWVFSRKTQNVVKNKNEWKTDTQVRLCSKFDRFRKRFSKQ